MDAGIVPHTSSEERELTRKRHELAILQSALADRELFLADLRARLATFEGRYLRDVGVLYAELDEWNAKLAEMAAEVSGTDEARTAATNAREQAKESHAAAHGEAAQAPTFSPSLELKGLYREVIRQIHPDNAADEADRVLRNRLTSDANLAYRRGDAEALRQILEEYKRSPESVKGDGIPADLERIQRQIERIIRRLTQIDSEVAELLSSDLARLMARAETAASGGRNLLAQMAQDVSNRIRLSQAEFEAHSSRQSAR
jgi:hypothetical protein